MGHIYSARLAVFTATSVGPSFPTLGTVGNTIVIRSIDATPTESLPVPLLGFSFREFGGPTLWEMRPPLVIGSRSYQWRGRQVGPGGAVWEFDTGDDSWDVFISGYDLSP